MLIMEGICDVTFIIVFNMYFDSNALVWPATNILSEQLSGVLLSDLARLVCC